MIFYIGIYMQNLCYVVLIPQKKRAGYKTSCVDCQTLCLKIQFCELWAFQMYQRVVWKSLKWIPLPNLDILIKSTDLSEMIGCVKFFNLCMVWICTRTLIMVVENIERQGRDTIINILCDFGSYEVYII